jgi:hypothetical protein
VIDGRPLRVDATTPKGATTAKSANNKRADEASVPSVRFTTTPASPAPKAPQISCTVLIAAAGVR